MICSLFSFLLWKNQKTIASALECWQCSWSEGDGPTTEFCKDPFKNNSDSKWAYIKCDQKVGYNSYCRKTIDMGKWQSISLSFFKFPFTRSYLIFIFFFISANDKLLIGRGCYARPANATEETCGDNTPSHVTSKLCQLCQEDGCNNAVQFTSTIPFIVTSMMIANILSA